MKHASLHVILQMGDSSWRLHVKPGDKRVNAVLGDLDQSGRSLTVSIHRAPTNHTSVSSIYLAGKDWPQSTEPDSFTQRERVIVDD